MRITVRLPADLLRRAKKKAAEERRTLTSLMEEGLKAVLMDIRSGRRAKVRLPISKASGGTLPGINLNRSADLEDRIQGF